MREQNAIREMHRTRTPMSNMPEFTQEDFDLAMEDMFEVLENMPAASKQEAYDTVGRSFFKEKRCSFCGESYREDESDASDVNRDSYCSEDCEIAGEQKHGRSTGDPED